MIAGFCFLVKTPKYAPNDIKKVSKSRGIVCLPERIAQ